MRRPKRVYGTHPDLPDHRNLHHEAPPHLCRRLPARVDLRPGPPIYTQGSLNSCSANALAAAMWFDELKEGLRGASSPSRLFIYYNERARTGRIGANIPVSLRDGYKAEEMRAAVRRGRGRGAAGLIPAGGRPVV